MLSPLVSPFSARSTVVAADPRLPTATVPTAAVAARPTVFMNARRFVLLVSVVSSSALRRAIPR